MKQQSWSQLSSLRACLILAVVFCIIAGTLAPAQSASAQPSLWGGVEIVFETSPENQIEYDYAVRSIKVHGMEKSGKNDWAWDCNSWRCLTPANWSPLALRTGGYRWTGRTTITFKLEKWAGSGVAESTIPGSCTIEAPSLWRWSNITVYLNSDGTCRWK